MGASAWLGLNAGFGLAGLGGLAALLGLGVGLTFAQAAALEAEPARRVAARLYTADLVGACLGALLSSVVLLPWGGLGMTTLTVAGLNLAAATGLGRIRDSE